MKTIAQDVTVSSRDKVVSLTCFTSGAVKLTSTLLDTITPSNSRCAETAVSEVAL